MLTLASFCCELRLHLDLGTCPHPRLRHRTLSALTSSSSNGFIPVLVPDSGPVPPLPCPRLTPWPTVPVVPALIKMRPRRRLCPETPHRPQTRPCLYSGPGPVTFSVLTPSLVSEPCSCTIPDSDPSPVLTGLGPDLVPSPLSPRPRPDPDSSNGLGSGSAPALTLGSGPGPAPALSFG